MIPIGDDNYGRRSVPFVTYLLIAANFLVFFVELNASDNFIVTFSVVPARLLANPLGQFYTVFSAMFMHAGWLHILGNMLYLWIFGDNIEDRIGHGKFLVFYLLCGIAATFAQVYAAPRSTVPNLGASGAIAGVLGAYLVLFPRQRVRVLLFGFIIPMSAIIVIGLWFLLQVISEAGAGGASGGVAYMAHIGGFLTGAVLILFFRGLSQRPSVYQ
ncbi:MAG: rhomboid family intramembrane serine protease [Anaerolineaceae bacterium]